MKFEVEWANHFHSDGTRRRRPPASTMHGWLTKMRGTLIGNEELRSRGMREMKEAASVKKYRAQVQKQRPASTGKSMFSFLGIGGSNHKPNVLKQRPPQSRRTTHDSSRSARTSRPPARPSGTSHRSSHRSSHRHDNNAGYKGQRRSSRK